MRRSKIAGNRIHLRLRLLERNSGAQAGDSVEIAIGTPRWIEKFRSPEIHGIADAGDTQIEVGAERREMHVGQSDAHDERRRWPNAAQIDHVDVQNLTEKTSVRSEAPLPKATPENDLRPSQ